jgi:hypothetical protein
MLCVIVYFDTTHTHTQRDVMPKMYRSRRTIGLKLHSTSLAFLTWDFLTSTDVLR